MGNPPEPSNSDIINMLNALADQVGAGAGGFNNSILAGQGTLIRTMIQSPNYVPGVSGWTINKDGSAEFNNLSIRGTFNGTNYTINSDGAFFYSGTPAAGNLIQSLTSHTGTDPFGNVYLQGVTTYTTISTIFAVNINQNALNWYSAPTEAGPYTRIALMEQTGGGTNAGLSIDIFASNGALAMPNLTQVPQTVPNMVFGSPWNQDNWHTLTLQNGVTVGQDINGTNYPPAYTLTADGYTKLKGVAVAPAAGLPATTTIAQILNPDYLPQNNVVSALMGNQTNTNIFHATLRPNGNIQFTSAIAPNGVVYLDCEFGVLLA
jgi:hypothetical protein